MLLTSWGTDIKTDDKYKCGCVELQNSDYMVNWGFLVKSGGNKQGMLLKKPDLTMKKKTFTQHPQKGHWLKGFSSVC